MRYGILLLAAGLLAEPGFAQRPATDTTRTDTGSVSGVVRDGGQQPVEGARVRDARTGRVGLTDVEGRFHLRGLPAGRRLFDVMAIGYGMATGEVEVFQGKRTELSVTLLALPSLDTVFVAADGPDDAPREFLEQIRDGTATRIFTSDEIAQRSPVYTSSLLTLVPGVRVIGSGPRAMVAAPRGAGGACVRVFLDGYPMQPQELNSVPPSMLAGVAFYHALNAPPQYMRGGPCAVVLLWTKVLKKKGR